MKKIILFLAVALLSLSFAAAYPVSIQLNGNMGFNAGIYHCSDYSCSALGSLYSSGSGSPISYTINNEGSGTQYFAEYDYVSDRCYASQAYKNWFDESTGNGPWQYSINLEKQSDCQSMINSLSFDLSLYDNETQQVTASIRSPFNLNPDGPQAVPTSLQYYYSTSVSASLEIRDHSSIVYTETLSQDIAWSTSKDFVFTLPLLQAGDYSVAVKTNVNDCVCNSHVEQTKLGGGFTVLASQQQNQTTNILPSANFVYSPLKPNASQSVYFDASSSYDSDGTIASYSWNFGDSSTGTGVSPAHAYSSPGNYSVMLRVIDNLGGSSSLTKVIEVISSSEGNQTNQTNNLPVANFVYSPLKPNASQSVYFDASSSYDPDGSIVLYSWNFGDSSTGTGTTVTHSYSLAGNYTATLTVTDNGGNSTSISKIIEILNATGGNGGNQNQTNQTTSTQTTSYGTSKGKQYGSVDNIALRNFIFNNNYCGKTSDLTFEVYNQQTEKMKDVKVIIEIPELNIKEESQFFNLGKFESNLLIFNLKLPNVQGSYYARLEVSSQDNMNVMIKKLDIICETQQVTAQIIDLADSQQIQANTGITGNVIASAGGNITAGTIWLVFFILLICAVIIKLLMMLSK